MHSKKHISQQGDSNQQIFFNAPVLSHFFQTVSNGRIISSETVYCLLSVYPAAQEAHAVQGQSRGLFASQCRHEKTFVVLFKAESEGLEKRASWILKVGLCISPSSEDSIHI